jgi:hypothetical protein
MKTKYVFFWLMVIYAILTTPIQADVIKANSCSQQDVQAAIDMAVDGDTVTVLGETCTWTTPVTLTGKAITLQGAGIGRTVIMDGTGMDWNQSLLWVEGLEGKPFRITGIEFREINDPSAIIIRGTCRNFRVDNCRFYNTSSKNTGVETYGYTYGVIDHCDFHNTRVVPIGDAASWKRPLTLGSADAVYIEDSTFTRTVAGNSVDPHIGARCVFRHNIMNNAYLEVHGFCCNLDRSAYSFEYYDNTFNMTDNAINWVLASIRGGTGVIFNNTAGGHLDLPAIVVYNDRSSPDRPNQGICDGSNPVDGNEDSSGYPCMDQIGRATDAGDGTVHPQALEPLYEWNNTYNGADVDIILDPPFNNLPIMAEHLKKNRDYYNNTQRPGYKPYTYPHPLTIQFSPPPKTDFNAPTVPQNVRVVSTTSRTIQIAWDSSTDTGGSGLAGYFLWVDGRKVTSNSDPAYTQYTFLGLASSRQYHFIVSAFDAAGNESAKSDPVTATTNAGFTISGKVIFSGAGLADVLMSGLPSVTKTAAGGDYTATIDQGWSGTVTPTLSGYTFTPISITYSGVTSNQTGNYTAAKNSGGGGSDSGGGSGGGGCFIAVASCGILSGLPVLILFMIIFGLIGLMIMRNDYFRRSRMVKGVNKK